LPANSRISLSIFVSIGFDFLSGAAPPGDEIHPVQDGIVAGFGGIRNVRLATGIVERE